MSGEGAARMHWAAMQETAAGASDPRPGNLGTSEFVEG